MPLGKRQLVLGCGNQPSGKAINHDIIKHRPEVDVVHDLNKLPWPWLANSFDAITARAVLEHLHHDLMTSMNELWRIGGPGCVVDIKLPYWRSEVSYNDLTHRWMVGRNIFDQLDPSTRRGAEYSFYTPCKWHIISCELNRGGTSVVARLESLKGK